MARAQKTGQAMARRARIVLAAAGMENKAICVEVHADANTVGKWRRRFAEHRLDGLLDEPRPGTPRKIGDDEIADKGGLSAGALLAWACVGVPIAWGVYVTLGQAVILFG